MFLIAIILYRTILSIIISKSEYSFLSFSVSSAGPDLLLQKPQAAGRGPEGPHRSLRSRFCSGSSDLPVCFQAGRIASLSGSVLNLLVILMLSRVYIMLAHILTRWGESHHHPQFYWTFYTLQSSDRKNQRLWIRAGCSDQTKHVQELLMN